MASEAQRRANNKFHEKFDMVRFRIPKGEKELLQEHAKKQGESLNSFLIRAAKEAMARDVESGKI